MKKILLLTIISSACSLSFGQGQIGNSDMEAWEQVAGAGEDEPVNWNSFLTASGGFSGLGGNQVEQSVDVRPGSAGTYSCRIFATTVLISLANGNITLGQVNMGSTSPTGASNYNITRTTDPDFSQTLTDLPDSIVFWVKFNPNGGNGNARMKSTVHDDYDYRDPEDAVSPDHIVSSAVLNFPSTNNQWVRKAVPYVSGPASTPAFIIVTFTTNETGGQGNSGDEVFIDDIELIYNPNSVDEMNNGNINVSIDNSSNVINISSLSELEGYYDIYNTNGQSVQSGELSNQITFNENSGVYFVHILTDNKNHKFKIVKN